MPATILVIDDDQTIRELLQLHLRNAGYAVHVAEDAVEAGHLVLRSPPDLIISDVNMPHMDGFEFIAAVRADNSLPYIPVIFLTSEEEGEIRGKELGAVASGVTSKGHWLATLCGRISVRCSGRSPKRSLRWPTYAR